MVLVHDLVVVSAHGNGRGFGVGAAAPANAAGIFEGLDVFTGHHLG